MGEKNFFSLILTKSVFLLSLGLGVLLFPKITPISFGLILCFAFLAYGGYKTIDAFITRHSSNHFILSMISGTILFIAGIILYFAPLFNFMIVIALLGTYFILESITTIAFLLQTKSILNYPKYYYLLGFLQLLFGLFIIIFMPSEAIWIAGILTGIDFLLSGIFLILMYYSNKYVHR